MYQEFLDFIFPLAEGAGKIQLAYFRGDDLAIRTKSNVCLLYTSPSPRD